MAATLYPMLRKIFDTRRVVWLFPDPVRTAHTETTGLEDFNLRAVGSHQTKIRPGCIDDRSFMHHDFVRNVGIGKHNLFYLVFFDQADEVAFGEYWNAGRVE